MPFWGRVSIVARMSDCHADKVGSFLGLCSWAWHFITLASSVHRDVNGGPVGRNWLGQWFQTSNLSFTFFCYVLQKPVRLRTAKKSFLCVLPCSTLPVGWQQHLCHSQRPTSLTGRRILGWYFIWPLMLSICCWVWPLPAPQFSQRHPTLTSFR